MLRELQKQKRYRPKFPLLRLSWGGVRKWNVIQKMEREFIEADKERLRGQRAFKLKIRHAEMGGQTFHMEEKIKKIVWLYLGNNKLFDCWS